MSKQAVLFARSINADCLARQVAILPFRLPEYQIFNIDTFEYSTSLIDLTQKYLWCSMNGYPFVHEV